MVRKKYNAKFKAKVALEAVRNDATTPELSKQYEVHPTQIQLWKSTLEKQAETIFTQGKTMVLSDGKHLAELERKVGQLTIENDFLKKNFAAYHKKSGSR